MKTITVFLIIIAFFFTEQKESSVYLIRKSYSFDIPVTELENLVNQIVVDSDSLRSEYFPHTYFIKIIYDKPWLIDCGVSYKGNGFESELLLSTIKSHVPKTNDSLQYVEMFEKHIIQKLKRP